MEPKNERIEIIAELHPQHGGSIDAIFSMMLQCKTFGADMVKFQLYSSQRLFGDDRKKYAEITLPELSRIKRYADSIDLGVLCSVFDEERFYWCEQLSFSSYKIASRTFEDMALCHKVMATNKPVYVSNGFNQNDFRYDGDNVHYFLCISDYPARLEDIPNCDFKNSRYMGFSDHTFGLTAAIASVVRGAKVVEKHFTLDKSLQANYEKGHLGSMDCEDLRRLRGFCDSFVRMQ